MASKSIPKVLRSSGARQLTSNTQRRTFVSALNAVRATSAAAAKPAFVAPVVQQKRGMKTIDFAGHKEVVYGMLSSHSVLEHS